MGPWFAPLRLHFQHHKTPNRWENKVRGIFSSLTNKCIKIGNHLMAFLHAHTTASSNKAFEYATAVSPSAILVVDRSRALMWTKSLNTDNHRNISNTDKIVETDESVICWVFLFFFQTLYCKQQKPSCIILYCNEFPDRRFARLHA